MPSSFHQVGRPASRRAPPPPPPLPPSLLLLSSHTLHHSHTSTHVRSPSSQVHRHQQAYSRPPGVQGHWRYSVRHRFCIALNWLWERVKRVREGVERGGRWRKSANEDSRRPVLAAAPTTSLLTVSSNGSTLPSLFSTTTRCVLPSISPLPSPFLPAMFHFVSSFTDFPLRLLTLLDIDRVSPTSSTLRLRLPLLSPRRFSFLSTRFVFPSPSPLPCSRS